MCSLQPVLIVSLPTMAHPARSPCSGTTTVSVNPLPTAYIITGGCRYCFGGTGVPVGLSNSTVGINYQLLISGSPVGFPVSGMGTSITFGSQATAGTYTATGTN